MSKSTIEESLDEISASIAPDGYCWCQWHADVIRRLAAECGYVGEVGAWTRDDDRGFMLAFWVPGWSWRGPNGRTSGVRLVELQHYDELSAEELEKLVRAQLRSRVRDGFGLREVKRFKKRRNR